MGIQYGWFIPQRVIYVNFYNRVTVQEYNEMNKAVYEMLLDAGANIVHIIQDESNIRETPPDFGSIMRESVVARGYINGWVITIGKEKEHPIMKFISKTLTKLGNTSHQRFHFLEEAEAYLQAVDPTLDFSQAQRNYLEITSVN